MRTLLILLTTTMLAACGGGDAQSVASNAVLPGSSTPVTGTTSGGTGGGVAIGTGNSGTAATSTFLAITTAKTFQSVGSLQSLSIASTGGVLYSGNASTVRTPSGTIAYDPRDGIFTLTLGDTKANVNTNTRYQDPAHRTDFNPVARPSWGVPDLVNFNYLEALGTSEDTLTFFYQRPGVSTNYVSLAGYVRNPLSTSTADPKIYERGAMVFGDLTPQAQIPVTGTGTYSGGFLATMVNNSALASRPTYFQWIAGTSSVNVDFSRATFNLSLTGSVTQAEFEGVVVTNTGVPQGAIFTAAGSGTIDFLHTAGFTGSFQSAQFASGGTTTPVDFASVSAGSSTAGASSIDGAFYGPNAVNVGGNFRIVGGIPNQRVDILGAFTGAKQ
jgi:hypothetical protein